MSISLTLLLLFVEFKQANTIYKGNFLSRIQFNECLYYISMFDSSTKNLYLHQLHHIFVNALNESKTNLFQTSGKQQTFWDLFVRVKRLNRYSLVEQ